MARCKYEFGTWHCPHDAVEGKELCIFHLPVKEKDPTEFWKHLASYLNVLYNRAGNEATTQFIRDGRRWFQVERSTELVALYRNQVPLGGGTWRFTGFVFPAMDETHNFRHFVFAAADFSYATFNAKADFRGATFSAEAYFSDAKFSAGAYFLSATFSAGANFFRATFSAKADFWDARFSAEADFWDAKFSAEAYFSGATFSAKAYFGGAAFSAKADFSHATFNVEADFWAATFGAKADFSEATFSDEADFTNGEFKGDANFSFVRFLKPPSFSGAEFKARVDFYEAKLPGLSEADDERTARNIRLLAERYGSYADAGDFYIIEMDYRRKRFRKTPGRWLQYVMMELYRLTSRYGESPGRAVVSLLTGLLGFSFAYVLAGFKFMGRHVDRDLRPVLTQLGPTLSDLLLALRLALANLMPGNLRGDVLGLKLTSTATKTWAVFQVITTYVLLTLLILAIRRRFRR